MKASSMRYILVKDTLSDNHPLWPGETLYKVRDTLNKVVSYGAYTNELVCQDIVDEKNENTK